MNSEVDLEYGLRLRSRKQSTTIKHGRPQTF